MIGRIRSSRPPSSRRWASWSSRWASSWKRRIAICDVLDLLAHLGLTLFGHRESLLGELILKSRQLLLQGLTLLGLGVRQDPELLHHLFARVRLGHHSLHIDHRDLGLSRRRHRHRHHDHSQHHHTYR